MLSKLWIRAALGLVVAAAVIIGLASCNPAFAPVGTEHTVAAESLVDRSPRIAPFVAHYDRWQALLGVRRTNGSAVVTAQRIDDRLEVVFEFSNVSGVDRMLLHPGSLTLEARSFGAAEGPGQRFARVGNRYDVELRDAEGQISPRHFEFAVPVLEPSVLELPLALLQLDPGDAGSLPWTNYADPVDLWLPFRALRNERIVAGGHSFETTVVRVAFPGGRMRDYWIASEAPYKVRMVAYETGRLITTGWELQSVELGD